MIVTPIPPQAHGALAARLQARGWSPELAADAVSGLEPAAFLFEGLHDDAQMALLRQAGALGLDCLTGAGWAMLAGSRSRLGSLARPWLQPDALRELSTALGLAMPADPDPVWRIAGRQIRLDRPQIMAILNVTPDSFSDGSAVPGDVGAALARAESQIAAGATIIDVGGESTRPGRTSVVPAEEEIARVVPVIRALVRAQPSIAISVDTVKGDVAEAALEAGAAIVNDVSGGRLDPRLLAVAARAGAGVVLMHSRGANLELAAYTHADYDDAPGTVLRELGATVHAAREAGLSDAQIVVDPGLGFGKTPAQTLSVLHELSGLRALGLSVLVGPSRKRFLGSVSDRPVAERDALSATACALAFERGARIFRVHAARPTADALALVSAMRDARSERA